MAKKIRYEEEMPSVNMTALIDIVFMMVIFFIVTVKMDEMVLNQNINLVLSPHGKVIDHRDPRTVYVDVDMKGRISVSRTTVQPAVLKQMLARAVTDYGSDTPIIIAGDAKVQHKWIRKVMDACTEVGIWKLKFMALKEPGGYQYVPMAE